MAQDQRHLNAQVPIDGVQTGGFRFGGNHRGMSHQGSLMGLPGRTQAWDAPDTAFDMTADHLAPIFRAAEELDVLVIGTGKDIAMLPDEVRNALREAALGVEVSTTRAAVRTYNILLSEDRRVAAALMVLT